MYLGRAALALALSAACLACARTVAVTSVVPPAEAARVDESKLQPRAIIRDGTRYPLPEGARVLRTRVVVPATGERIPITPSDGIEMHGELAPGDAIPGGGRVEAARSTGALIAGALVLGATWLPTAYVGLSSPRAADRVLMAPLIGPWIDWAGRTSCVPPKLPAQVAAAAPSVDWCIEEDASRVALVTSGGLQVLGAALLGFGIPTRAEVVGGDRGVAIVPTPGGLAAIGTF